MVCSAHGLRGYWTKEELGSEADIVCKVMNACSKVHIWSTGYCSLHSSTDPDGKGASECRYI